MFERCGSAPLTPAATTSDRQGADLGVVIDAAGVTGDLQHGMPRFGLQLGLVSIDPRY